jgi:hypothetical protein
MIQKNNESLEAFGFSFKKGGAHTARTMMLEELRQLLDYIGHPEAVKENYLTAIEEDNCLGKRSGKTRKLTFRHLVDLYALDPSVFLFRALLYFWERDQTAQPLLALLCSYSRDPILRDSASFILKFDEGQTITRVELEEFLDEKDPGRFSPATLKSTAQNINSTWTQSGHLVGRAKKVRDKATASPGSISYALLLGFLTGVRGESLFKTDFVDLLECSTGKAIELAEESSRKGWIVFKRIGTTIEVLFPNLINQKEIEMIREQN